MNSVPSVVFSSYRPAAVLRVTGEDALAFLQGQFTQELRFPIGPLAAYGLWLNQKGKVHGDSFALRDGESWWLTSIHTPAVALRERLDAYIIADDVTVENVTEEWQGYAIVGSGAGEWLKRGGVAPPGPGEWSPAAGGLLFRGRRDTVEAWEWLVPASDVPPLIFADSQLPQIDGRELERRRIRAGIPRVGADIGPNDLPNEGSLEEVAISYSKGCYLGQEVIARLKSMGQVRRQLVRVSGTGAAPAVPAPIYLGEKKVGEVRSVASDGADGFIGLALVSLLNLGSATQVGLEPNGSTILKVVNSQS